MKKLVCVLALLLMAPGCAYLRCEVGEQSSSVESVEVGRDLERFATLTYQATPPRLLLQAGEILKVRYDDIRRAELGRRWDVEFFSLSFAAFEEFEAAGIFFLPITIPFDFCAPVVILFVTPVQAIFKDTDSTETHKERLKSETTIWKGCLLRDPATGAELAFPEGTALIDPETLALNGFSSATLDVHKTPGDTPARVAIPAPALEAIRATRAALEAVPVAQRISVPAGGDLHAAVRSAPPGSWIQLEEGVYTLRYALSLWTRDLTVAGRGAGRTRLVSASGVGLSVSGGPVTLRGLHVALETPAGSLSTGIRNTGTLRAVACEVSGARGEQTKVPPTKPGEKETTNFRGGVGVTGSGRGVTTLEACSIRDHYTAGVFADGDHTLSLRGCEVLGGQLESISVRGRAQAKLEGISASGGHRGLLAMDSARLEVSGSRFAGQAAGISLGGRVWARVTNNTCYASEGGIFIEAEPEADLEIRGNTCRSNRMHGITVQGKSAPRLIGNTCSDNAQTGILFADATRGLATGNTCSKNRSGIGVQGTSTARLEKNQVLSNKQSGLQVSDRARPTLTGNTSKLNSYGLSVAGTAEPLVTGNFLEDNEQAGVNYAEQGGGTLIRNQIKGNKQVGIFRSPTSRFTEQGNTLSGNARERFTAPR